MIDGKKKIKLYSYLTSIVQYMRIQENDTKIHVFDFERAYNNGCSWHPSREDHLAIAEELLPFYEKIMGGVGRINKKARLSRAWACYFISSMRLTSVNAPA